MFSRDKESYELFTCLKEVILAALFCCLLLIASGVLTIELEKVTRMLFEVEVLRFDKLLAILGSVGNTEPNICFFFYRFE